MRLDPNSLQLDRFLPKRAGNPVSGRSWALVVLLAFVTGCVTSPTGRRQLMIVSPEVAIAESASAYVQTVRELDDDDKLLDDPALERRVEEITGRVVAAAVQRYPHTADWRWSVALVDDPETVNAWCMAGGRMAVYSGLIERLALTDDELAHIMGHEASHAIANHTAERMSLALLTQLGVAAAARERDDNNPAVLSAAALAAQVAVTLPNSRTAESEADRMGMELAVRAGYDPAGAVTVWRKMEALGESRPPEFLSSHPSPDDRRAELAALIEQMGPLVPAVAPQPYPINIVN